jgi:cytoskeletal protein RodZ
MKELDATQVEQLKTIGAYLGRERQERGVSLDEIAVKTYIPLRLLQALEEGQVERLPEPIFVQGFIRRHAEAIGLDGVALAKTFSPQPSFVVDRKTSDLERSPAERSPVERLPVERPPVERPSVKQQPTLDQRVVDSPPVEPKASETSAVAPVYVPPEYIQRATPHAGRGYLPWALLGTAVALLLGAGLVNLLNRPQPTTESQESTTTQPSQAVSPQPSIAANSTGSSQLQASPSPSSIAQPGATPTPTTDANATVQVAVNLTGDSWFQVTADGKPEFEGILKKGEQKTWTAQKTLVLEAGNAGAVSVSYNQGEAKLMGAPGEVKDMTFTAAKASKPDTAN